MPQPTILIVDDQPLIRMSLRSALAEFEVLEAGNGVEALEKVEKASVDLILLDLDLPGMDGTTTLSILKDSFETKRIPIIVVTSYDDVEEKIKCLELGADDYLTKPFHPRELRARIKTLLRSRQEALGSVQNFVHALMKVLSFRDSHTAAHSHRTAFYALKLAHAIEGESPQVLHTAGLLHDIGKIGIREGILAKPEALEPDEFELIKFHPLIGERICTPIKGLRPILPIIRHHHERFDGGGYPDSLKGEEIPLGARIMAIAESFDTITCDSYYRVALPSHDALDLLRLGAGSQWDPDLVEAFCAVIQELGELPINVQRESELSSYFH